MADMKFRFSSHYNAMEEVRGGDRHTGIDLAMPEGTELRTLADGVVTQVFDGTGKIGEGVKIRFENGQEAIYGHMSEVKVKVGEILQQGEIIGLSGSTGRSTGPHLHFGLKENGEFIDPTHLADEVAEMSGKVDVTDPAWWDLKGRVNESIQDTKEEMKEEFKETMYEFLDALGEVIVEIIDSVVLVGGGTLIILRCWGLKQGTSWLYIGFAARVLLKIVLGGYA